MPEAGSGAYQITLDTSVAAATSSAAGFTGFGEVQTRSDGQTQFLRDTPLGKKFAQIAQKKALWLASLRLVNMFISNGFLRLNATDPGLNRTPKKIHCLEGVEQYQTLWWS